MNLDSEHLINTAVAKGVEYEVAYAFVWNARHGIKKARLPESKRPNTGKRTGINDIVFKVMHAEPNVEFTPLQMLEKVDFPYTSVVKSMYELFKSGKINRRKMNEIRNRPVYWMELTT